MENAKNLDAGKNTVSTNSTFCMKVLSIDRILTYLKTETKEMFTLLTETSVFSCCKL